MTQSFTPESSFTMQTDASSSKRSAGDKFTEAVSFSGETTGIAIAIDTVVEKRALRRHGKQ